MGLFDIFKRKPNISSETIEENVEHIVLIYTLVTTSERMGTIKKLTLNQRLLITSMIYLSTPHLVKKSGADLLIDVDPINLLHAIKESRHRLTLGSTAKYFIEPCRSDDEFTRLVNMSIQLVLYVIDAYNKTANNDTTAYHNLLLTFVLSKYNDFVNTVEKVLQNASSSPRIKTIAAQTINCLSAENFIDDMTEFIE